ncbi:MAG TPA: hypothetical protein VHC41_05460 [Mycobacteriales bacterium]|nr:hypothetical protein [Mycobacteriales bacterium]
MTEPLADLLARWIPQQRWYGAQGRQLTSVAVTALQDSVQDQLHGEHTRLSLTVATVSFTDGEQAYQVPLSLRTEPWDDIEHALIGHDDSGLFVYDAPHDPDAAALLLDALHAGRRTPSLSFQRIGEINTDLRSRLIGAEQSNTSLVYGDELICKLFRRVAPGRNPDLELTRALQDAGCSYVAPVHGWIQTELDGDEVTLGLLQEFVPSATEGWALATTSVRDLYAEADLHADEVGGDFAAEAHRLGAATAEVHAVLARTLPTARATAEDTARTVTDMHERVEHTVAVVPELGQHAPALHRAYDQLAATATSNPPALQRIHGDYHLGQVLRTDTGWLLLDFEGEPARPLAQRRSLASPLRDVAGMFRSFDYAARSLLADRASEPGLTYRAGEWAERNRDAFCDGYAEVADRDPREDDSLLRAFELDKAVYEVGYEVHHRPTWLPIPLGSIARLVA